MSFVKMPTFDDYKLTLHTEEVTQKLTEVNPMSFFVYKRKYVPKKLKRNKKSSQKYSRKIILSKKFKNLDVNMHNRVKTN